jgi:hypothetical protein
MPGAKGAARQRGPLAWRKRATGPFDEGKHSIGDPDDGHPPILNPVNPYTGGGMFDEAPDLTPRAARKAYRKQAWTGWGPAVYPKVRKVAGWDWNDYQNGYLANSPRHFECSCGDQFPTPSGFHRCACGKQWNSYVIGTGGSNREAAADTFIVREVPVRPDVIVANRKLAGQHSYTPAMNKSFGEANERLNTGTGGVLPELDPDIGPNSGYSPNIIGDERNIMYRQRGHQGPPGGRHRAEATVQLVDKHGNIHNLVDPGELGDGDDPGHPTFKKQPKDWARRGDGAKWIKNPIG